MDNQVTDDSMTTTYRSLFDVQVLPQAEYDDDAIPSFEQPLRPDPDLIDLIHREHDGYVCITRKRLSLIHISEPTRPY